MVKKRATKRKATKTKRKTTKTKRKTTKTKRKTTKTKRKTKKAFGGYSISKAGIAPSEMTKKLWKFIKNKRLGHK